MKLWRWLESNQYYQITKIQKIITTNLFSLMCLIVVGGRCRTGGKRSSAPNAIRKKHPLHLHRLEGGKKRNNL